MGQGYDNSLIFIRTYFEHEINSTDVLPSELKFILAYRSMLPSSIEAEHKSGKFSRLNIHFKLIILAGKIYPFALVVRRYRDCDSLTDNKRHIYSFDEYSKLMCEYSDEINKRQNKRHNNRISAFFKLKGTEIVKFTEIKVAIALIGSFKIKINPILNKYEFYRTMNPWEVFQELSMFWGNIAAPERITVSISDKDRIKQYGFDKWSFRKQPESY